MMLIVVFQCMCIICNLLLPLIPFNSVVIKMKLEYIS